MSLFKTLIGSIFETRSYFEDWIVKLAKREGRHCEFMQTTGYGTLTKFMQDRGAQVLRTGKPYPEESVTYRVHVRGSQYDVQVSRAANLHGVLLTSEFSSDSQLPN